jgi:hypothetical protein
VIHECYGNGPEPITVTVQQHRGSQHETVHHAGLTVCAHGADDCY